MKKICLYFCLCLFIFSCKKSNINDYSNFIGTWNATETDAKHAIEIKSNGRATYEKTTKNTEVFYRGKCIVSGNELKIGFKKFEINHFPEENLSTGIWEVKLDNLVYSKH